MDVCCDVVCVTYEQVGGRGVGLRVRVRLERAHHVDDAAGLQVARLGRGREGLRQALQRGGRAPAPAQRRPVRRQRVDAVSGGGEALLVVL